MAVVQNVYWMAAGHSEGRHKLTVAPLTFTVPLWMYVYRRPKTDGLPRAEFMCGIIVANVTSTGLAVCEVRVEEINWGDVINWVKSLIGVTSLIYVLVFLLSRLSRNSCLFHHYVSGNHIVTITKIQ
jgi:tetrahydromethanopterin S-methyltransferase subunit D